MPTPFIVGDVNVYLIQAGENLLIDTGPETDAAWEALLSGLTPLGLTPRDIDRVWVTHTHEDHYGLSARLADAGARIYLPEGESLLTVAGRGVSDFYRSQLSTAGVPRETAQEVLKSLGGLSRYGRTPSEFGLLRPETTLELADGGSVRVLATPGHTPGHLSFLFVRSSVLFAGDTIIRGITPNPILSPDPQQTSSRYPGAEAYLATLRMLDKLMIRTVYSGHRDPVEDIGAYLRHAETFYENRQRKILQLVESEAKTVFEIALGLFSNAVRLNVFLVVSETLAHLDYLQAAGRVVCFPKEGVCHYSTA